MTKENEKLKARELETSRDLLHFERNLTALDEEKGRLENQHLKGTVQNQDHLRITQERELKKLRDEPVQETVTKQDQQQKVIKLSNEVKAITSMRDSARDKHCKLRQEERMAAEREGQWTTRVMGHSLLRKGRIMGE